MLVRYDCPYRVQIGIDEAGRGPLFGRVYAAAVVLNDDFDVSAVADSKTYKSQRKIKEAEQYVKSHTSWCIKWGTSDEIDQTNILRTTLRCMREAARSLITHGETILLVDGNVFDGIHEVPHVTVVRGDALYACIAAASILAKCARDEYIRELCDADPSLDERYGLRSNKGYGTKKHVDGLKKFGATGQHRMTFAPCANAIRGTE